MTTVSLAKCPRGGCQPGTMFCGHCRAASRAASRAFYLRSCSGPSAGVELNRAAGAGPLARTLTAPAALRMIRTGGPGWYWATIVIYVRTDQRAATLAGMSEDELEAAVESIISGRTPLAKIARDAIIDELCTRPPLGWRWKSRGEPYRESARIRDERNACPTTDY